MNFIAATRKFWQPSGYSNNNFDSKAINEAGKNFTKMTPNISEKGTCEIDAFSVLEKARLKLIGHMLTSTLKG